MTKANGNLWTSVRDPSSPGPLGRVTTKQLKALEKAILEIDWEAEQKYCKHERVEVFPYVDTRNFYWEYNSYLCMDCGLESKYGIGIYAKSDKI